jgi:hypothetical protein
MESISCFSFHSVLFKSISFPRILRHNADYFYQKFNEDASLFISVGNNGSYQSPG